MSRIGKLPVQIPDGVTVDIKIMSSPSKVRKELWHRK